MPKYCSNCRNELDESKDMQFCPVCKTPTSNQEAENFEKIRYALLPSYNYQTVTHGGYMVALSIGALSLVSRWKDFESNLWILFLILSLIVGLGVYIGGRIIFWAYLSSDALHIRLPDLLEKEVKAPIIARFQIKAVEDFVTVKTGRLWKCVSAGASSKSRVAIIMLGMIPTLLILIFMYYCVPILSSLISG